MALKADAPATNWREIDRWDGGAGWIAHPEEGIQRASHVVSVDGEAWVIDPVDAEGIDGLFEEFGEVAGVVVTVGRHQRDADAVARRHAVPVYAHESIRRSFRAPSRRFRHELADTGFRAVPVVDVPGWQEAALFDGDTLVVGDALGTTPYYLAGGERLGVQPVLRAFPPAALRGFDPDRVLVGHGEGVLDDAGTALRDALASARRNAPEAWVHGIRWLLA